MKLETRPDEDDLEVDMSPMIDMVFLLLIFFLVASTVIDKKIEIAVPSAAHAKVPEDTTGRLKLTVTADETVHIGNNPTAISDEDLKVYLAKEKEINPESRIMIRADGNVKYKVNEKVTLMCAEVGFEDIIYSAYEE